MPELAAKPALAGLASIGEGAGVRVRLRGDFRLVSVLARPGQANALADAVQAAFAMALIDGPKHTAVGDIAALGIGPHRWLFLREGGDRDFPGALATVLTGLASLSDQSAVMRYSRSAAPTRVRRSPKVCPSICTKRYSPPQMWRSRRSRT